MSDHDSRDLHHDLRSALSAVQMNLQTLEALDAVGDDLSADKVLMIVGRARQALQQAVDIAERLREEERG